ncbi:MAG: urease accessory protein UreD [Hydrogenophaga sp.]|nr:urease accessory protein UreD [Hydrogenophaga sp.]
MPWHAQLHLDYRNEAGRTLLRHRHDGPLRILKSLYPEGEGICHNVIVHPPGGLVGGDRLDVTLHVGKGAHALVSTPGATRFYAAEEADALQQVTITLDAGARLEWLPLETIAHPGCRAHNRLSATLGDGAEMMGWDVTALGLPAAGQPFDHGCYRQRVELPGLWLEQATIDAADTRLLDSPLGLDGQRCLGSLWLASGKAFTRDRREHLLEVVRAVAGQTGADVRAGATCPHPQVLVLRAVAPLVEPLMALFQHTWAALRPAAWGLPNTPPRIWRV